MTFARANALLAEVRSTLETEPSGWVRQELVRSEFRLLDLLLEALSEKGGIRHAA